MLEIEIIRSLGISHLTVLTWNCLAHMFCLISCFLYWNDNE